MQEIAIRHGSRMANRLLQYLTAEAIAGSAGGCRITGHDIPEWGLRGADSSGGHRRWPRLDHQRIDIAWLTHAIDAGAVPALKITAVTSDLDLLPDRATASALIDAGDTAFHATGPDEVVIHVRLEDILVPGRHTGYGPLPLAHYRAILAETGLRPVFVGQFGEDAYSTALRAAFPDATILRGGTALQDFQTIRHAHNVILGVSTFSWLAAWLGTRDRIFYPLKGVLDPRRHPQINLMPVEDARYRFHAFPDQPWTASHAEIAVLIDGPSPARAIDAGTARAIRDEAAMAARPGIAAWRERFAQALRP